jgi:hypothetical protein
MEKQEQELLEGYRKLRPESKRLIMATVISAVTEESGSPSESWPPSEKRQCGFSVEGNPVQVVASGKDSAIG